MSAQLLISAVLVALGAEPLPDIRSVPADLQLPELQSGPHAAGKRFKEILPEYANTSVYHVTYLPVDWQRGINYPVIVEYAGMPDRPDYMQGIRYKAKAFEANGVAALFLYPWDVRGEDWQEHAMARIDYMSHVNAQPRY